MGREYGPLDKFNYQMSKWHGLIKYKCYDCPYYVFENQGGIPRMIKHCRDLAHGLVRNGLMTIDQFIEAHQKELSVNITFAYLCWNTKQASVEGVQALLAECDRLERMGCKGDVAILDNGSTDGTWDGILEVAEKDPRANGVALDANRGISVGRNYLIELALQAKPHYILMLDGDIELVPLSSFVMARYLECHRELGCIGAYSSNYTNIREEADERLIEIPEIRVKSDIPIAWTQYGLFRASMFEQGLRFDETGAFGEPGWGFEDDELFFNMQASGWGSKYFCGMRYLHRNIRSSWVNLERDGTNLETMFIKRKEHLISRLTALGVDRRMVQRIRAQQLPG
jgi:GT2 family glycosyltransferase